MLEIKSVMTMPKPQKKSSSNFVFGALTFAALFIPVLLHSVLGIAFSPVLSNSMAPGFRAGDLLITKEGPARSLKVGQVVVLRNGTEYQLFSHRIIALAQSADAIAITTKGDANPTPDTGIAKVNLLASIPHEVAHVPFLGRPIVFFSQHKFSIVSGFLLFLAALLLILRLIARKGSTAPITTVLNQVPTPVIPPSLEVTAFEAEKKKKKKAEKEKKSKTVKKKKNQNNKKKRQKSKSKSKSKKSNN
jgi:signal peptidase